MIERVPLPTKVHLYHAVGVGLRIYVLCLAVAGLYSLLWLAEIAGYLDERTLGAIWLAIAAMGTVFLVLLIPLYYTSRSGRR